MLRITGGSVKNKKILVPASARPITDRIRTSIMDLITDLIPDANVLDLFSGSGSFGIECLSRGAKTVIFVESDNQAIDLLKKNIEITGFYSKSTVHLKDAKNFLDKNSKKYSIIMVDPPFKMPLNDKILITKKAFGILSSNGLIILRMQSKEPFPESNELFQHIEYNKRYGVSRLYFLRKI